MKRFLFGALLMSVGLSASYASTDPALQALFANDADDVLIERLPVDAGPFSLGLFKMTDDELDGFERPKEIGTYLASLSGITSFHSKRVLDETNIASSSVTVRRDGNHVMVDLVADDEPALLAACRHLAEFSGKPILIDVFAENVKAGKEREKRIVAFVADVLARHPDEIESILQIDPEEQNVARIHVLGGAQ